MEKDKKEADVVKKPSSETSKKPKEESFKSKFSKVLKNAKAKKEDKPKAKVSIWVLFVLIITHVIMFVMGAGMGVAISQRMVASFLQQAGAQSMQQMPPNATSS